jgi:hypothetical protein
LIIEPIYLIWCGCVVPTQDTHILSHRIGVSLYLWKWTKNEKWQWEWTVLHYRTNSVSLTLPFFHSVPHFLTSNPNPISNFLQTLLEELYSATALLPLLQMTNLLSSQPLSIVGSAYSTIAADAIARFQVYPLLFYSKLSNFYSIR